LIPSRFFSLYWGAAIVCLPLFFRLQPGVPIRFGQDMLFLALIYLSIVLFGFGDQIKKYTKIVIPLAVLSVYSFINQFNQVNYTVLYQWFCFNGALLLICQLLSHKLRRGIFINAMAIACLIQSIWLILNSLGIDPYQIFWDIVAPGKYVKIHIGDGKITSYVGHETDIVGSLHNRTLSGAVICGTIATLFRPKWFFAIPIAAYAVILTDSSMIYLSTFAAILVYFTIKFKKNIKYVLINLAVQAIIFFNVIGVYGPKFLQDSGRFRVWENTLVWLSGKDIMLGNGLGYFSQNYNRYFEAHKIFRQAHNEYLEYYIAFGLVGIIISAFLISPLFSARKSIIIVPCLAALLVDSFGSFPFHIAATALIGIICYCLTVTDQGEIHGIYSDTKGT